MKVPGEKKVLCGLCNNYLGTTSNLREHLHCHHKDKYKQSRRTKGSDSKEQTNMDTFFTHSKCLPSRAKKITELIAFMVLKIYDLLQLLMEQDFCCTLSLAMPSHHLSMLFIKSTPWLRKNIS